MLRAAWLGAALATAGAADDDQAPLGIASPPLPRRALQAADERAALLAFKASGTDPDGMLSTWLDGTDPCGWDGVTCHADGAFAGTVEQVLRFGSAGLTGDVGLLARAFEEPYGDKSDAGIDDYSARCLRRVWRAERFSWWFTSLMHKFPETGAFGQKMQAAELDYLVHSRAAATA